jgi:hypothetical protein
MKIRGVLAIGAALSMQAGCTCSAAETATPTLDSGELLCDNAQLERGCVVDKCTVAATGNPLPEGSSLTVTEIPAPPPLNGDTLDPVLCSIAVPSGVKTVPNLVLSIATSAAPASAAVLFQYVSPILSELVTASGASGHAVEGLVVAPGEFGTTQNPGQWSLAATAGITVSLSATEPELLLNLSSEMFNASFYDGTHLFLANGPRILIYDGIPANPDVPPSVVLGQPDLDTFEPQVSSSLFGTVPASAIWSDGTRLVVGHSNRILIWNSLPTVSQTPADVVLGQPDFSSNAANSGGVSATSLSDVAAVDSDGTQLVAADLSNNRLLLWKTFPIAVDQAADFEVGQVDFSSAVPSAGAVPLYEAWGVALDTSGLFLSGFFSPGVVHLPPVTLDNPASDFTVLADSYTLQLPNILYTAGPVAKTPSGGLAVRDVNLYRVAMLNSIPTSPPPAIDFVLGQPDLTRVAESLISASLVTSTPAAPSGSLGSGSVFTVPDRARVLVFDTPPSYNFEPATRVIGQPGFTTNGPVDYRGILASTLAGPSDVAISGGTLAVADRGNNRVLLYTASGVTESGAVATVVLGQSNATSYVPNLDQQTPSASTISGPGAVALDGTHLIVSDTENHRVLIWNSIPTTTGAAADLVLGQADFTGRAPNRGRGDTNGDGFSDAGPDGFFYPMGVASDGTHLFVVDRMNHRVLVWNSFPTSNGQAADAVIGQPDFTTVQANFGMGAYTFVANGLNLPTGATLVGTSLWIADTENNRLVRWDSVTTSPTPGAVVGQSSLASVVNPNYELPGGPGAVGFPNTPLPTSASSTLRPRAIVVSGPVLYATEMDSNRVHRFDSATLAPLGELGQLGDTLSAPNANGVSAASMSLPLGVASDGSNLWVADSGNHRVLAFPLATPPGTGAPASLVLGQVSLLANGFNQSSTAADGATSLPHGLSVANGQLYVADTGNSRVLVMKTPVAAGDLPLQVYGQPNGTLALQNSGGPPSGSSLNEPRGVYADGSRVIIADTANHRVLVFGAGATTSAATLVLGQPNFSSNSPNPGGATASTMQGPSGAYTDGTSVWVADTGNHRVLGWKTFPTKNGQAADLVLGQASFGGILGNRGTSEATATSMSFPSDVKVINGALYVADSGNNRVLSFSKPPVASGVAATGVLGQPNLTSRIAAILPTDLNHMAGPVALAQDQENLYVTDRDLGRALVFHIGTLGSGAVEALGAAGGLALSGPAGIASQASALFTSEIYVSDTGASQLYVLASVSRVVQSASP